MLTSIEICAGAGGQALGLEQAGFEHTALIEIDGDACKTLRLNRPQWNVIHADVREFSGSDYVGVDLLAGGVPCPPFSIAGKQLGHEDERDLFPEVLRLVREVRPKAIMIENVRGLMGPKFAPYRESLLRELKKINDEGYCGGWQLLNASDYGVPQLRPRAVLVAMFPELWSKFEWPQPQQVPPGTVGETLWEEMASSGWQGADDWATGASSIAPTLVGGSRKHGGPDLGPTRAKEAWKKLGVDGMGIANSPPDKDFVGMPKLTVKMAASLQGFPRDWRLVGGKTSSYRQVGNAFPPPVAAAVGRQIKKVLEASKPLEVRGEFEFSTAFRPVGIS